MTFHPRERAVRADRRQFLQLDRLRRGGGRLRAVAAGGVRRRRQRRGLGRGGRSLLAARTTRRPCRCFDEIQPIADGLDPETGGTLKIFNYAEYVAPDVLEGVREGVRRDGRGHDVHEHGRGGRPSCAAGEVGLRRVLPDTGHRLGQLVAAKLLQPLNHSYLPNLANVWERCRTRSTTRAREYTVPYTAVHDRRRVPGRPRSPSRPTSTRTRTTSSGTRPTAARCTCSRTTARCSAWRCCGAGKTDVNTEDADADRGRPGRLSELTDS